MSAITYVRFYPSDWLAGTRGMTAAEMGVYITLIAMMYERAGPVDGGDNAKLARLCGTSASGMKTILERLVADGKITREGGLLFNRRAELEIKNVMSKSEVATEKANARWAKNADKSMQEACSGIAPAMLASNQYPVRETEANTSVSPHASTGEGTPKTKARASPADRATRLPRDWTAPPDFIDFASDLGFSHDDIRSRIEPGFRDYWISASGAQARKADWFATWRNWLRREAGTVGKPGRAQANGGRSQTGSVLDAYRRAASRFQPQGDVPGGGGDVFGPGGGVLDLRSVQDR
jgi:uncharacterized protein YdaU (DUF1376 family)